MLSQAQTPAMFSRFVCLKNWIKTAK